MISKILGLYVGFGLGLGVGLYVGSGLGLGDGPRVGASVGSQKKMIAQDKFICLNEKQLLQYVRHVVSA